MSEFGDLSNLPRSLRWRIQLRLFVDPSMVDPAATTDIEQVHKWNEEAIAHQNDRFQQLMEKYIEEEEEEEEAGPAAGSAAGEGADESVTDAVEIDPLTAMVREQEARETRKAELYLKYRKERARRKRGLVTETGQIVGEEDDGIDRASLVIIEKDLKRLPHPTEVGQSVSPSLNPKNEARMTHLREILYIYAQEHPEMGYRQGMHEIASYLLYVLELEQSEFPDHPMFNPIVPICFGLLEKTLGQIRTAYDAGDKPLQQMSEAILGKILQNDSQLHLQLTTSPNIPPPPIYCTRWVRLLFSREVVGYENVFRLWDVFLEYDLMRALEMTSAARILLLRDALLNPANNPLELLMNVPQLPDISPLTDLLRRLMLQKSGDGPIQFSNLSAPLPDVQQQQRDQQPMMQGNRPAVTQDQYLQQSVRNAAGHPLQLPSDGTKFSFSKMRQTLGQKGESLRQKIITTTNEWKQAAQREASVTTSSMSASSDLIATASEVIRNHSKNNRAPAETVVFADPLLNTPSSLDHAAPFKKRQQHETWSHLLKHRVWTVQEYIMAIESNEMGGRKVPREIWEALADLDRIQNEIRDYSTSAFD